MLFLKNTVMPKKTKRKNNSKNKKKAPVYLSSSVVFEKCDSKNFIKNSEIFLNSIGIGIFIFSEKKNLSETYSSPCTNRNLNQLIELYGEKILVDFYKTFTTNPKLKKLKQANYDSSILNPAYIHNEDKHHTKYIGNIMQDLFGDNKRFAIYCNSEKILKTAGYAKIALASG